MSKKVDWTKHAEGKFKTLKETGFSVTRLQVLDCLANPDRIDLRPDQIKIAQKDIDKSHVLRVVFREEEKTKIKIITFHPGSRRRYEKKNG